MLTLKCVLADVGGICLNGGTSVTSLASGEHMFCLCADSFEGNNCENGKIPDCRPTPICLRHIFNQPSVALVKRGHCYDGVGLYYRGTVSRSESGQTCEEWDPLTRERHMLSDVSSGRHNYCR